MKYSKDELEILDAIESDNIQSVDFNNENIKNSRSYLTVVIGGVRCCTKQAYVYGKVG